MAPQAAALVPWRRVPCAFMFCEPQCGESEVSRARFYLALSQSGPPACARLLIGPLHKVPKYRYFGSKSKQPARPSHSGRCDLRHHHPTRRPFSISTRNPAHAITTLSHLLKRFALLALLLVLSCAAVFASLHKLLFRKLIDSRHYRRCNLTKPQRSFAKRQCVVRAAACITAFRWFQRCALAEL